jgi:hypothetical protein
VRRIMFTVVATVLMAGAVPASALAQHHKHHKHHARHHARFRRFGHDSAPTSMSSSDNAGTVQSFQNGVLTITLNDGSTVKGAVTNDTELECMAPENSSSTTHEDGDGGSGDQGSGDDNQSSGTEDQGDNDQNEAQGEDQNEAQGEDQNEDQNEAEGNNCSTSSLTPGAVVHEASLRIGSGGATWQKVELVS